MSAVIDAHTRLTEDEADTVKALSQLEQALFALHIVPVQERMRRRLRQIEDRLGLKSGAIGTTHVVDGEPLTVSARAKAPAGDD